MSTYFRALMRSSAMRVGAPDAAPAVQAAVPDGLVEIHDEQEAAPSVERRSAITQPALPDPPGAESLRIPPAAADAPRALSSRDVPEPRLQGPVTRPSHDTPVAPAIRLMTPPVAPAADRADAPVVRTDTPQPDPVRLAMQWIAADPETRAAAGLPRVAAGPPSVVVREEPAETVSPHVVTRESVAPLVEDHRPARPTRQPAVRTIAPAMAVQQTHQPSMVPVEPSARTTSHRVADEEPIEISIGAITLHVEAPAPRTVVQPAPRQEAASRRRPERSGLHRRYLRSF